MPVYRTAKKIGAIYEKTEKLIYEMKPNGGESLRDAINRLEKAVGHLAGGQRAMDQKLRTMFSLSGDISFETDIEGGCIWVSSKYLAVTGRQLEEVRGNGWVLVVAEEDQDRVFSEWCQAISQEREFECVYNIKKVDGGIMKVSCRAFPIRDASNCPVGWFGIAVEMV